MTDKQRKVKALYPHPFPDFELEPEKWLGVSFGTGRAPGSPHDIPLVGFVFADHEYAAKIHGLIVSWTGGQYADHGKSIRVAVIADTHSSYIFFCHPNFDHPEAVKFYEAAEDAYRDEGVIPEREAALLFLGRRCEIGPGSRYEWFRRRYHHGVPVMLEFSVAGADGSLSDAKGTRPIIVFDVLFANKAELQDTDPLAALLNSDLYQ